MTCPGGCFRLMDAFAYHKAGRKTCASPNDFFGGGKEGLTQRPQRGEGMGNRKSSRRVRPEAFKLL